MKLLSVRGQSVQSSLFIDEYRMRTDVRDGVGGRDEGEVGAEHILMALIPAASAIARAVVPDEAATAAVAPDVAQSLSSNSVTNCPTEDTIPVSMQAFRSCRSLSPTFGIAVVIMSPSMVCCSGATGGP